MRIAVMDLGTNTFHLLIVEQGEAGFQTLFKAKTSVKLGENGIASGIIASKPFQRGIRTLKRFKKTIDRFQPGKIIATGTAAIREASNKKAFLDAIFKETGIRVQVIPGNKEALLIYEGVKCAIDLGKEKALIMDIGGGSVEFIIADQRKLYWKGSFKLGAALLLDRFKPYDPITADQLKRIRTHIQKELAPLLLACKTYLPISLIGSSGSFDTFAEIIAWRFYKPGVLKGKSTYRFHIPDYQIIHQDLIYSTADERRTMKGLVAMRIDMIVIASILLTFVLEKTKIKQMELSTYALKEGVCERILNHKAI